MRTVPLLTLQSMFSLEGDEFPIILLMLEREGYDTWLLSSDPTERIDELEEQIIYGTVSRGEDFLYFPFQITLASDEEGVTPRMRITVDNVTAEIGWWLREATIVPTVTVEIISSGDLDTPIASFPDFELRSFSISGLQVEGELRMLSDEHEPFPAGKICPAYFPGMF